ncbi:MAG: DUF2635 domain-containing protein [Proteobacteria bacterium]|nr:DUF2635 domain-containing protein [Pseudomonadota bacterium]MBU1594263.1 DUF2635 domain-containing protein [Pseudomonadota bacterium]
MPEIIFVKPAPGLVVRDPVTKEPLPPQGARKEKSTHWLRRKAAGDVEFLPLAPVPAPAKTKPAAQAAPKE